MGNVINLSRIVPFPAGLLSVHKSGEENETGSIIEREITEWGASASSRCVKYD